MFSSNWRIHVAYEILHLLHDGSISLHISQSFDVMSLCVGMVEFSSSFW
jgi:hypothetical protein